MTFVEPTQRASRMTGRTDAAPVGSLLRCSLWIGALICLSAAMLDRRAAAQEVAVALRGAAIETIADGRIDKGNVVVRDGKIEAVGSDAEIPNDARVIDAAGLVVMPGIVDPLSRVGLGTAGARGGAGSGARGRGTSGASFSRAADIFYPYQRVYEGLPRSGITTLSLAPSGFGQAAVVRLLPEKPDEMMLEPRGALVTAVTNQTSSLDVIRNGLKRTKAAGAASRSGRPRNRSGATPQSDTATSARRAGGPSSAAELWSQVAQRKRWLVVSASNAAGIAHLAETVEPYKDVKLAVAAPGPVLYQALEPLKKCKARVLLAPTIDLRPNSRDRINVARKMHAAGLKIAFTPSSNLTVLRATQDAPLFPVAYLVQTGLPRQAALEALTIAPAEILGLADRLGTIEPKKDANLLVFRGDPLDPSSRLVRVIVEGTTVYEN
jgi:imidazolonepropionase-like amidohydrolase